MLKDLNFPVMMDTSTSNLIDDFFQPALSNAMTYDRGVGFFSSGWLRINAQGMVSFAAKDGRARWVTSPILSETDWDALQFGQEARTNNQLQTILRNNINDLAEALEQDTLSALAWMVADGILDFKLALPQNKLTGGDFHDKFGLFADAKGNHIAFHGSYNESIQGLRNYEGIHIFKSWEAAFKPLVDSSRHRFERLWHNEDPNVRVFNLPDAAREQILRLRKNPRPYPEPERLKLQHLKQTLAVYQEPIPTIPEHIELRDYQADALEAWFAHDCRGLLEMATGTGKTITALAASARLFAREEQLAVIVAAPYQHLVDQWAEEAAVFGYQPILAYQSKAKWLNQLNDDIVNFNGGYRRFISVITTHTTFSSPDFQQSIARLRGPALIIADEVHHLGAERSRHSYPEHIPFRLALSATPDRWFDDVGTAALRAFFGQTVFAFTLEQAIGVSLVPYYYYPHLVELTEDELKEYDLLTTRIGRVYAQDREEDEAQEILHKLLLKRARLLNTAENKLTAVGQLVDRNQPISHALFYCAPEQMDPVTKLLGLEKGLLIRHFTARESNSERQEILADFAGGGADALVAMKCLDEGVDVPDTRTAFFLASSGNPREFIQRRGRILRQAPDKPFAVIHDLITIPPVVSKQSATYKAERSIIKRELGRFREFANPARNKHEAVQVIWEIATHYGLRDF